MATSPTAFLVVRRDDGFGDVYPLSDGTRYTLGRAPTNRIVLRDDLCSREHAEVFPDEGAWFLRDLGSLNGTQINGETVRKERRLSPLDELKVGRVQLVFIEDLTQLLRLCLAGPFDPKAAGPELLKLLARAADVPDFATLEAHLADTQAKVRASFVRILGRAP